MLFDRQRVLLELLDALNEPVGSTDFQKLLFLYTREGEPTPSYDFVPYRFGCFSFTSYADKRRLVEQELIEDGETWKLTDKGRRIARSGEKSPLPMARFAKQYKNLRGNALVADVYQRYPYFATRSEIVGKVLPKQEDRARVESARPVKQTPGSGACPRAGRQHRPERLVHARLQHRGLTLRSATMANAEIQKSES